MLARNAFFIAALAAAGPGLLANASAEAQCSPAKRTSVTVPVYDTPPEFSTANGWFFGPQKLSLAAGVPIQVCASRGVGFLGGQKLWLYIHFAPQNGVSDGWIFGEGTVATTRRGGRSSLGALLGPAAAYAQGPGVAPEPQGLPADGTDLLSLFWAVIGILLGMAAKGAFDSLQAGGHLVVRDYLLRTTPALLISPMVFLSLAKISDIHLADAHGLIVAFCVAFQSGFFWQTVLVRGGSGMAPGIGPSSAASAS